MLILLEKMMFRAILLVIISCIYLLSERAGIQNVNQKTCPKTEIRGNLTYGWDSYDQEMLNGAKSRCMEKYLSSPCVKVFTKTGKRSYKVVCGAPS